VAGMEAVIALISSVIIFAVLGWVAWLVFAARIRRHHPTAVEHLPEFARAFWTPWRG
jgi:hypothetical protein